MPATIAPRHIAATRRTSSRRPSFALIAPTRLTFLYDGVATWSTSGPISRRSQFMILSSEVAAAFAGSLPVAGYGTRETSTTKLEVDYVRVWEAPRSSTVVEPAVAVSDPPRAAPPAARAEAARNRSRGPVSGSPCSARRSAQRRREPRSACRPPRVIALRL